MKIKIIEEQYHTYTNHYEIEITKEKYNEIMKMELEDRQNHMKGMIYPLEPKESNLTLREMGEELFIIYPIRDI